MPRTNFTIVDNPAAGVAATIAQAAGAAGVRNYLQKLQATVAAPVGAAVAPVNVHVRDGLTGAGAILWSGALSAVNDTAAKLEVAFDPPIMGTAATAMTIEFAAASAAATIQGISGQGFSL